MHKYLKAIGYGNITSQKQLNEFLKKAEETFSNHEIVAMEEELDFCEYQKECGAGIGINLCGSLDIRDNFERQYLSLFCVVEVTLRRLHRIELYLPMDFQSPR